jgi:hypothetical protein
MIWGLGIAFLTDISNSRAHTTQCYILEHNIFTVTAMPASNFTKDVQGICICSWTSVLTTHIYILFLLLGHSLLMSVFTIIFSLQISISLNEGEFQRIRTSTRSWDCSIGVASRGRTVGFEVWLHVGAKEIFFLLQNVQTSPGAHPAFYTMGTRVCFLGGKVMGLKLTTRLHLGPRWKGGEAQSSLYHTYILMAQCWNK